MLSTETLPIISYHLGWIILTITYLKVFSLYTENCLEQDSAIDPHWLSVNSREWS